MKTAIVGIVNVPGLVADSVSIAYLLDAG